MNKMNGLKFLSNNVMYNSNFFYGKYKKSTLNVVLLSIVFIFSVQAPASFGDDIILDNGDSGTSFVGSWSSYSGAEQFGNSTLYVTAGGSIQSYRFTPTISVSDTYEVFVWNSCYNNRPTNVPHVINHANGSDIVEVDQDCDTGTHGEWFSLGHYFFNAGMSAYLEITDNGLTPPSTTYVGADAARFISSNHNTAPVLTSTVTVLTLTEGDQVNLTATANDAEEGDLTAAISWSDDASSETAVGGSFSFTPALGVHNITMAVSDAEGDQATASIVLTVVASTGDLDDDADGLSNDQEGMAGTDPNNSDSDNDGVLDGPEVLTYNTNPLVGDTDSDGIDDRYEIDNNLNPNSDDSAADPDSDGRTNLDEYLGGTDPNSADPAPSTEIILDNGDSGTLSTGSWSSYSGAEQYGSSTLYTAAGGSVENYRFTPTIVVPGTYDVFVWNSCYNNRPTNVPHIINYNNGTDTVLVDQDCDTGTHGEWFLLGNYTFNQGNTGYLEITDSGLTPPGTTYIGADAARFVLTGGNAAPVVTSSVATLTLTNGEQANLTATASDAEDGDLTGFINWSDDASSESAIGGSFIFTPALGVHNITVAVSDSEGRQSTTGVVINVVGAIGDLDNDLDGLTNDQEDAAGTDRNNADSDNDGLLDGVEVLTYLTNPLNGDTDNDGLDDRYEVDNSLNPNNDDSAEDPDSDGRSNLDEYLGGTDPNTADPAPSTDIILDNGDVGTSFTATWSSYSGAEQYGSSTLYARAGGGVESYRFTPTINAAGTYDVFVWNSCYNNRAVNVPHTITHKDGSDTVFVDQDCDTGTHGEWFLLGRYSFNQGNFGYLEISDTGLIPSSTTYVGADAARFTMTGPDADSDNDGVIDINDAFPLDMAASVDGDQDGYPDNWNIGYGEVDSSTGLNLDNYPDDTICYLPEHGVGNFCDYGATIPSFNPDQIVSDDDGIVYFLSRENSAVYRWSVAASIYIKPIVTGLGVGASEETPSLVAYSSAHDRLYLGYSTGAIQYVDLHGNLVEQAFANIPLAVEGLAAVGNYILAQDGSGAWETHYIFDIAGNLTDSKDWNRYSREYAWNEALSRVYFFRDGTSPNDLNYENVDQSTGLIDADGETPYHGDYSIQPPIRISVGGQYVLLGSGDIYNANDLTWSGSIDTSVDDALWLADGSLVTLQKNTDVTILQRRNSSLAVIEQRTFNGESLGIHSTNAGVVVLTSDSGSLTVYDYVPSEDSDGDGVHNTVDAFPLDIAASLDSDADGYPDTWNLGYSEADSTTNLSLDSLPNDEFCYLAEHRTGNVCDYSATMPNFTPDQIVSDHFGNIYLLNRDNALLYRWSVSDSVYMKPLKVGLENGFHKKTPELIAYSEAHDRLYLGYNTGAIQYVDLQGNLVEQAFANIPLAVEGLAAVGNYILAQDGSGAWETHYIFDIAGNLTDSKDWNRYSREYAWNEALSRVYFFRDGTSPNDLNYENVDQNTGLIVADGETPYHGGYSIQPPIRVSEDGQYVLLGSGDIYNAGDLTWSGSIGTSVDDALWLESVIVTIDSGSGASNLSIWNATSYQREGSVSINGEVLSIFPNNKGIIVISNTSSGLTFTYQIIGDQDGDGIPGWWESIYGFDDENFSDGGQDADTDGLSNLQEYTARTDPTKPDSDDDGMTDGWEVQHGLLPVTDDGGLDADGDGYTNLNEFLASTNPHDFNSIPYVSIDDLSMGNNSSCALVEGEITCWGNIINYTVPSNVTAPQMVGHAGEDKICALQDNVVICWGNQSSMISELQASPVNNAVSLHVTPMGNTACVITISGSVNCWGGGSDGIDTPPIDLDNIQQMDMFQNHACAHDGTTVSCWGRNSDYQTDVPSDLESPKHVSVGGIHSCAIQSDNQVRCWGDNSRGQTTLPVGLDNIVSLDSGFYHTCSLNDEGEVHCWGDNTFNQIDVPNGLSGVVEIHSGPYNNCAETANGAVCWGKNDFGQSSIWYDLLDYGVGDDHVCGFNNDEVMCFGTTQNEPDVLNIPADIIGPKAIGVGRYHNCLWGDSGMHCWGKSGDHLNYPQTLTDVTEIGAQQSHTCAIDNGSVVCWGTNFNSVLSVPSGISQPHELSVGNDHNCVLDGETTVRCWGANYRGQANARYNLLNPVAVAVGGVSAFPRSSDDGHTCVADDNGVQCWGASAYNLLNVPAGLTNIIDLHAGAWTSCALTSEGAVVCWGDFITQYLHDTLNIGNVTKIKGYNTQICAENERKLSCHGLGSALLINR